MLIWFWSNVSDNNSTNFINAIESKIESKIEWKDILTAIFIYNKTEFSNLKFSLF